MKKQLLLSKYVHALEKDKRHRAINRHIIQTIHIIVNEKTDKKEVYSQINFLHHLAQSEFSIGIAANSLLGFLYLHGLFVKQNLTLAKKHFKKASTKNYTIAKLFLARIVKIPEKLNQARIYMEKATDLHNENLCTTAYDDSLEQSYFLKAFKLFQETAELGETRSFIPLGFLYCSGFGVIQDFAKGAYCYQQAANRGSPRGKHELALCYLSGKGVEKDPKKGKDDKDKDNENDNDKDKDNEKDKNKENIEIQNKFTPFFKLKENLNGYLPQVGLNPQITRIIAEYGCTLV